MNNIFENNQAEIHVRHCPICGSTDLRTFLLRPVSQDEEGYWDFSSFMDYEADDITIEVNNVNTEVHCGNMFCGTLEHPTTHIPLDVTRDLLYVFWLNNVSMVENKTTLFEDLDETNQQAFRDFDAETTNSPFKGVLNDCPIIK